MPQMDVAARPAVDCHAHFLPRQASPAQPLPEALFDLALQAEAMDRLHIAQRVVAPPPFALGEIEHPSYHKRLNDAVAKAVARGPKGRFLALGAVPLARPAEAAAELARAMEEFGFAGAIIGSGVGDESLGAPGLAPFWAESERLGAFLLLHPSRVPGAQRMAEHHLRNLVGNPTVTALAAAQLIFAGVLDRWPGLRIVLSHGGGALPWIADRLDQGYAVRTECQGTSRERPSEYLRSFYYDTIVFSDAMRKALFARVGRDRIVYGTDAPFDMSDTGGQVFAGAPLGELLPALAGLQ